MYYYAVFFTLYDEAIRVGGEGFSKAKRCMILTPMALDFFVMCGLCVYAYLETVSFREDEKDPFCKRDIWLWFRAGSLSITVLAFFMGLVVTYQARKIMRGRGDDTSTTSHTKGLWALIIMNVFVEIVGLS